MWFWKNYFLNILKSAFQLLVFVSDYSPLVFFSCFIYFQGPHHSVKPWEWALRPTIIWKPSLRANMGKMVITLNEWILFVHFWGVFLLSYFFEGRQLSVLFVGFPINRTPSEKMSTQKWKNLHLEKKFFPFRKEPCWLAGAGGVRRGVQGSGGECGMGWKKVTDFSSVLLDSWKHDKLKVYSTILLVYGNMSNPLLKFKNKNVYGTQLHLSPFCNLSSPLFEFENKNKVYVAGSQLAWQLLATSKINRIINLMLSPRMTAEN